MDEETRKKGEELKEKIPELKTGIVTHWREEGAGDSFRLICELLKLNAIPTKILELMGILKKRRKKKA